MIENVGEWKWPGAGRGLGQVKYFMYSPKQCNVIYFLIQLISFFAAPISS